MPTPDYATNAPQGYMGDWKRGAPMGRPSIAPDPRSPQALEDAFLDACVCLSDALRLKENRPADAYKAACWEAAAAAYRADKATLAALYTAAKARQTETPLIYLRAVRIDDGGYDPEGTYFGLGEPIYWAATQDGALDTTLRAKDREDAKAQVRKLYPLARFFR